MFLKEVWQSQISGTRLEHSEVVFAMFKDRGEGHHILCTRRFSRERVWDSRNLWKFFALFESFRKTPDRQKNQMRAQYAAHNLEETTVQELKEKIKQKAEENGDDALLGTAFDLQQVILIPITTRRHILQVEAQKFWTWLCLSLLLWKVLFLVTSSDIFHWWVPRSE